jgi:hypothetical protein
MSAKHTPGPWRVDGPHQVWAESAGEYVAITQVEEWETLPPDQVKANARLISAAPDLLESLLMVRDADNDCRADGLPTMPQAARAKINSAIALATGEPA